MQSNENAGLQAHQNGRSASGIPEFTEYTSINSALPRGPRSGLAFGATVVGRAGVLSVKSSEKNNICFLPWESFWNQAQKGVAWTLISARVCVWSV